MLKKADPQIIESNNKRDRSLVFASSFQAVIVFMYIMHSWYLYLNILKENFIIYVPIQI